jgi:processive 1,2-diacylglycerol beta-glucosyltransferase
MRAAEAVEAACRLRYPRAQVQHVDVLTLTPPAFRKVYADAYLDMVNRAPELMGLLYERTNRPPRRGASDRARFEVEKLNTRKVAELAREFKPDVIVHTHFLPAEIVAHEKRRGRISAPHVVVVTDFDVHRFWRCPGADRYFVAREDNKVHLSALGEPADRVRITGIPILPAFGASPDVPALRRKHRIESGKPLLLVLCGGFGVGPIEGLVEQLWSNVRGAEIAVVTGRNEELRERLEGAARKAAVPTHVLGFTKEMHEWMALSSLVVTKPGGLTTSEALACGLPMVVANAIPGQETRNATMLFEEGVAISGENPYTVGPRVARLLATPARLAGMARSARRLGRPRAALDVADELANVLLSTASQ